MNKITIGNKYQTIRKKRKKRYKKNYYEIIDKNHDLIFDIDFWNEISEECYFKNFIDLVRMYKNGVVIDDIKQLFIPKLNDMYRIYKYLELFPNDKENFRHKCYQICSDIKDYDILFRLYPQEKNRIGMQKVILSKCNTIDDYKLYLTMYPKNKTKTDICCIL